MRQLADAGSRRARALGLAVALLAPGCGGGDDDPEGLADRFVDRVFVQFDQRGGLELAAGRARTLLEHEVRLVGDSRGTGGAGLREQPRVYWDRREVRRTRGPFGERVEARYRTTTRAEGSEVLRDVRVVVERREGAWRVVEYDTREP